MAIEVSVVIPTYNKKDFLEITLTALGIQTYPSDKYEVVIVNDGSTDATEEFISSFKVPYQISYIYQKNSGRSAARNHGIELAKGKTLIFIDDDCVPGPAFIENHMQNHRRDDNSVVLGYKYLTFSQMLPNSSPHKELLMETLKRQKTFHYFSDFPENAMLIHPEDFNNGFKKLVQLSFAGEKPRWEEVYKTYTAHLKGFVVPWSLFTTGNISISKRHCIDVGGFDENFRGWGLEDYELGYRLYNKLRLPFVLDKTSVTYRLIHWSNVKEDRVASKVKNYIYFCKKHPHLEVYLHWRLSVRQLDIHTYNALVKQYYELSKESAHIAKDYYQHVKTQCESYGWDLEYRRLKGR